MSEESENPFIKDNPANTRQKSGRKPMTPNFEQVVAAVERGEYDETLYELTNAINSRKEARQNHVLGLVREVFGEDANVITASTAKAIPVQSVRVDEGVELVEPEAEDQPTDPLAHLDAVEAKMVQEIGTEGAEVAQVAVDHVPIEQRGAAISGLHSSDMGE